MQQEVSVGMAGSGFMAATHLKAYRKLSGVRIGALCNPSGRNLDGDFSKVAGNIGDAEPLRLDMTRIRTCRSFEELLADETLDLIDICTPTSTHPSLVIAALQAGKHVLCEKPLARNSRLAGEMVEAAKNAKGFFMPAMCLRFWPEFAWLKEQICQHTFGRLLDLRLRRVAEPPAWGQTRYFNGELSGGALLDLHIHDVDFILYCLGQPDAVYAQGYTRHSGAIDHVVALFRLPGGIVAHAEGSWCMTPGFGFHMSFTANFENATVDYDLSRGPEALRLFESGKKAAILQVGGEDGYVKELAHMIDSIRAASPPTIVTAEDGLAAVRLCEAEEESIRTGKLVKVY